MDVTEDEFTVVRSDGSAHPRRFAYGVPLRGILGPFGPAMPVVVEHCDRIAAAAFAVVGTHLGAPATEGLSC